MTTTPVLPLWIARLSGDQPTMGRQHGELAGQAEGTERMLGYYRQMPERMLVGAGRSAGARLGRAVVGAAKELMLARLHAARPAELRARSEAFMAAAGTDPRQARYVGVMDVFQSVVGLAGRYAVGPFARRAGALATAAAAPACSTIMAWGEATADGEVRHARNFDFPGVGVWDAAPALILCAPDRGLRYGFVASRGADVPAVTVFNEAGITITSHTRFHREVALGGAAVIDLVHELGRRATSLDEARAIAAERPSATSWGLAVSSARERRAVCLELHAGAVRVVEPAAGAAWVSCANRYRDVRMQDGEVASSAAWALHTDARERRLRALMAEAITGGGASSEALMAMLADRVDAAAPGVVRHLGGILASACTVHSVVVEPATRSLLLGVGAAPASEGPFVRVGWSWDGPVGAWELGAPDGGAALAAAGLTAADVAIPAITRGAAGRWAAEAVRIEQTTRDADATSRALEQAITAAPADPSLRLGAVWIALRRGDAARAVAHARVGLNHETLPYRRGQLLLWGARAALAARDEATAAAWWRELDALGDGDVAELIARSRADRREPARWRRRKPDANLFMHDAA